MAYDPKAIANYFLDLAKLSGERITPMKLQKLVYYAHGWYAGYTGKPLINEAVEAWQYGPVIPSLYHEFKRYGSSGIKDKATEIEPSWDLVEVQPPSDPTVRRFLDDIWASYGKFTGAKLSEMTHAPGGPWEIALRGNEEYVRGVDIPFQLIADHFKEAVTKARARRKAAA